MAPSCSPGLEREWLNLANDFSAASKEWDEDVKKAKAASGHVMSRHVMSCHVMSCHVMSCHVMSRHVMSCHVMSYHVCNVCSVCNVR